MPPTWLPLAAILAIIAVSALRAWSVERAHGVKAFSFGRHAAVQSVAERNWKLAVLLALTFATMAWLAPDWERALGRPAWSDAAALKWASAIAFISAVALIALAQFQMGASWRIGVPASGPGPLVARGLFRWSRNPIFVGMIGAVSRTLSVVAACRHGRRACGDMDADAHTGAHRRRSTARQTRRRVRALCCS
ncbi:MAG: hypothetical protein IPG56_19020 [Caulobacteraceae bacterium]|nr:hypothetical protein [Caulobacteraceae bacterium]